MTQENPKQPVRNLERVQEKKFKTYDAAKEATTWTVKMPVHKVKIFARNDNTFDVVWYKKIEEPKALKIDTGSIPPGEVDKLVKNVKKEFNKRVKNGKKQHA